MYQPLPSGLAGSLGTSQNPDNMNPGRTYQPVCQRSRTHADTGARPRRVEEVLRLWPSRSST